MSVNDALYGRWRPLLVGRFDPIKIALHEILASEIAFDHPFLQYNSWRVFNSNAITWRQ
jgi:hypothetical protein